MKVCIAEKPSVAKEIAFVIGAKSRRDGFYEGNGYAVTWTFGHFCSLYNPDDYTDKWKRWDLDTLPMLPEKFETKLIDDSGVKKQFGIIKKLLSSASSVINCGDAGQEGELIQRWVLQQAKYKGRVDRLWISSLTTEAIKEGFKELRPGTDFDRLFYAGSARAIGDWLLGMNATRLFTLKYGGYKQVLSIGRVQTPTLAMLVARHHEIENFVSKPFWELHTKYREVDFSYESGRFEKKEEGKELLELVTGKEFTVTSVSKKKGKEYAPKLFDLTSLQVHCNKKYGYTADQTLKIVQRLYEMKMVTYPRVDTTYLPDDMYPKIGPILSKLTDYSEFTKPLLSTTIKKSKKIFDNKKVTDHHAIIPTGGNSRLEAGQQNVYDSIVRRFIAVFYPDCIVSNTIVLGEVEKIVFKTKGKEIIDPGWRVLFPKKKKDKDDPDQENILPEFKEGEKGPHDPSLVEKNTQPPKHYTEATLLRAMETAGKHVDDEELRELMKSNGIGRPSTRANIIETLFRRKYILRKRKNILASPVGIALIDTIKNELLKSPELTGRWEKKLRDIETGDFNPKLFINNMKKMVDNLVVEVRMEKSNIKIEANHQKRKKPASPEQRPDNKNSRKIPQSISNLTCPKCKKGLLLKGKSAYGCSNYKSGCSFTIPFVFLKKKISEKQIIRLVEKGSTVKLKGFQISENRKEEGYMELDSNYKIVFKSTDNNNAKAAKSNVIPCPKCKKGEVIRGKNAYGCSEWKSGCDFRFSYSDLRAALGKGKMTKEAAIKIISGIA